MSKVLSYATILKDRELFRKSGSLYGGEFNLLDTPGSKYFKIFFYFNNGDADNNTGVHSTGLLSPTWLFDSVLKNNYTYYSYNSAWAYLKMNREDERALQLEQFVNLLSNISSQSPWYFSEISGLDAALERKQVEDFKWEEARQKISIKCLPDAYDDRIATLLDLYRSIVWSWQMKREVLPANLRKFDMGIFIFNDPVQNFSVLKAPKMVLGVPTVDTIHYSELGNDSQSQSYRSSYKYIEFHNCEFDYNSSKSALAALNNKEGIAPEYTIDISFDDCYEYRFNESMVMGFGDMIEWDLIDAIADKDYEYQYEEKQGGDYDEKYRLNRYSNPVENKPKEILPNSKGFLTNSLNQIIGTGTNIISGIAKKAVLGNLYSFSLTKMANEASDLIQGDVWSSTRNIMEYVNDAKQRNENELSHRHSLFATQKFSFHEDENNANIGDMFPESKIRPSVKRIGNMHQANTLVNNI